MSKYMALGRYLREQERDRIFMSFADVESVLGAPLPPSALRHRSWWSNNPENNVATREWLDAGFETEKVDIAGQRLVFRRRGVPAVAEPVATWSVARNIMAEEEVLKAGSPAGGSHPLFGALKGTIQIPSGVDLTEPADPEWGNIWGEESNQRFFNVGASPQTPG